MHRGLDIGWGALLLRCPGIPDMAWGAWHGEMTWVVMIGAPSALPMPTPQAPRITHRLLIQSPRSLVATATCKQCVPITCCHSHSYMQAGCADHLLLQPQHMQQSVPNYLLLTATAHAAECADHFLLQLQKPSPAAPASGVQNPHVAAQNFPSTSHCCAQFPHNCRSAQLMPSGWGWAWVNGG